MLDLDLSPLTPISFFALSLDCRYVSPKAQLDLPDYCRLPSTAALCGEEPFAEVSLGWNAEGLSCQVKALTEVVHAYFPEIQRGDSVELFFDTRDVKTSGWNTRFCHHFFFLPKEVEGTVAGERTAFRTEDRHELCTAAALKTRTVIGKNGYTIHVFIPATCLHGFDPEQFGRLGFAYRINRCSGRSQHFSAVTRDYQVEQQPSLWSSMLLAKG